MQQAFGKGITWVKHDEGVGGVFRFFKSDGGYDTHVT